MSLLRNVRIYQTRVYFCGLDKIKNGHVHSHASGHGTSPYGATISPRATQNRPNVERFRISSYAVHLL